jgi:hypothetical protein
LNDLFAILLDQWMLLTAAGVFALFRALSNFDPLARNKWWKRALPLLPEVVGCAAVVLGSVPTLSNHPWPLRAAAGLWVAYLAKSFRKILGQTVLGDDKVISNGGQLSLKDPDSTDSGNGEVA